MHMYQVCHYVNFRTGKVKVLASGLTIGAAVDASRLRPGSFVRLVRYPFTG